MTENLLHTSIKTQFVHSMEDRYKAKTVHKVEQQCHTTHAQYFAGLNQAAYLTHRRRFPKSPILMTKWEHIGKVLHTFACKKNDAVRHMRYTWLKRVQYIYK